MAGQAAALCERPAPRDQTIFPCKNPSAGNGRHDRGSSARLIGLMW